MELERKKLAYFANFLLKFEVSVAYLMVKLYKK